MRQCFNFFKFWRNFFFWKSKCSVFGYKLLTLIRRELEQDVQLCSKFNILKPLNDYLPTCNTTSGLWDVISGWFLASVPTFGSLKFVLSRDTKPQNLCCYIKDYRYSIRGRNLREFIWNRKGKKYCMFKKNLQYWFFKQTSSRQIILLTCNAAKRLPVSI